MMMNAADTVGHNPAPSTARPEVLAPITRRALTFAFSLQPSAFGSQHLAISNPADLRFGVAPKPLTTLRGLTIGGGIVYPELNFTLPPMFVNESTMPDVRMQYQQIITGALHRAVELEAPGLVIEFETLPPMTENPAWGIELTRMLLDAMAQAHAKHGLKSVLRITPNDTREMVRPPRMRSGPLYEAMLATFEGCAAAGAELLSIESVGGKEVHDEALMMGDLRGVIFGLCVLGVRDMRQSDNRSVGLGSCGRKFPRFIKNQMYQEKHSLENYDETDEASTHAHAALDSPTPHSDCFGALFPDLKWKWTPLPRTGSTSRILEFHNCVRSQSAIITFVTPVTWNRLPKQLCCARVNRN